MDAPVWKAVDLRPNTFALPGAPTAPGVAPGQMQPGAPPPGQSQANIEAFEIEIIGILSQAFQTTALKDQVRLCNPSEVCLRVR